MKKITEKDFLKSRAEIEKINRQINRLLEKRFVQTDIIGQYKNQNNLPVEDLEREKYLLEKYRTGLYGNYIREIQKSIFYQSKCQQFQAKCPSVIFIGMPGCGKTSFGRIISQEINKPFADTDEIISLWENMTVPRIFQEKGEAYFRKKEREALRSLSVGHIIAVGGGAVLNSRNMAYLSGLGKIVYIRRNVQDLMANDYSDRPLLNSKNDIEKLYKERKVLYEKYADFIIENQDDFNTVKEKIKETVLKIMK